MANIKTVNPYGKFDMALRKSFQSERSRKQYIKDHNLIENVPMESNKHMVRNAVDEINYERKKSGLKELSSSRIVGNSPAEKYIRKYF
jgi:DNA replicative helicase MCM subunit Mcm2 (Cdc46/Mcm family)